MGIGPEMRLTSEPAAVAGVAALVLSAAADSRLLHTSSGFWRILVFPVLGFTPSAGPPAAAGGSDAVAAGNVSLAALNHRRDFLPLLHQQLKIASTHFEQLAKACRFIGAHEGLQGLLALGNSRFEP